MSSVSLTIHSHPLWCWTFQRQSFFPLSVCLSVYLPPIENYLAYLTTTLSNFTGDQGLVVDCTCGTNHWIPVVCDLQMTLPQSTLGLTTNRAKRAECESHQYLLMYSDCHQPHQLKHQKLLSSCSKTQWPSTLEGMFWQTTRDERHLKPDKMTPRCIFHTLKRLNVNIFWNCSDVIVAISWRHTSSSRKRVSEQLTWEGAQGTNGTSAGGEYIVMKEEKRNELMSQRREGDDDGKALKREEQRMLRLSAALMQH